MNKLDIYDILREMNIAGKYLTLAENHQIPIKELFKKFDNHEVIELMGTLGYSAKHSKSDNFFKVVFDDYKDAKFQLNLILKSGIVDIVICVWWKDEILTGVPISLLVQQISADAIETKKPLFRNYKELNDILIIIFELYEDFYSRVKLKLSCN